MGDMADYYIDLQLDQGRAFYYPVSARPVGGYKVTCKFCGKQNLEWGNDGKRWYLVDNNIDPHKCSTAQEDFA